MAAVADQVVVDVLANTDATKRQVTAYADSFERDMRRTENASNRAENAIVRSAGQQRAAYSQLGLQVQDITLQLASGTNAFLVLAQQGGQTASALANFGGTVGRVAGFLAGPAGSLLIALTAVAGMMLTSADNTDKAAAAKRKEGEAARNLKEAIEDLDGATVRANQSSAQSTRQAIAAARGFLIEAMARREAAKAAIHQALAAQRAVAGLPGSEGVDIATGIAVQRLQGQLDQINREIAEGTKKLASVGVQNVIEATEASLTATGRAAREYERTVSRLNTQLEAGAIDAATYSAEVKKAFDEAERLRNAEQNSRRAAADQRRAAAAAHKEERDAARETAAEERLYWSLVKDGNQALEAAARDGQKRFDEYMRQADELRDRMRPNLEQRAKEIDETGNRDFERRMAGVTGEIEAADAAALDLKRDLASGITDAISGADNLGDALVNAFERAALAAVESRIFELLSSGGVGDFFTAAGNFITNRKPAARASGGHVSAGQLYRINEGGGRAVEGFRPAGSGQIIPLGQMAARPQGSVTVVQPLQFDMRGAITTPELLADINGRIAQSSQAAAIAGKGMALDAWAKARRRQL